MCGIAGYFNLEFDPNEVIKVLRHRGPDEQNYWQGDGLTLISTRLSIQGSGLDGRQPMVMDGNVLVYNGELYNHGDLKVRFDIKSSGKSDTESILWLLGHGDYSVLGQFDGMFALGFYNSVEKKITLARDYFGEKPLYYFWDGSVFAFASELKAIYKMVHPEISDFDINSFLATGFFLGARTCYKNVFQLEPGKKLDFDLTKKAISISGYRENGQSKSYVGNKSEAKEEGLRLLRNSVISRLTNSDREVGIYLSGGIDSGLITALASAEKHRLKTFTIAFDGLYNESPLAKKVSEHYATDHREIHINPGHVSEDLETILGSYGEPMVDDSAIPSFYVAREASKYVSVVLSGDGGDELFAGYRRYIPFSLFKLFQSRPKAHSDFLLSILPRPGRKIHLYNYFYRLLNLRSTSPENIYFAATLDLLYDKPEVFKHGLDLSSYFDAFSEIADLDLSKVKKILRLDRSIILSQILLKKTDISSMYWSLEARCPFLNKDLLQFTNSLSDDWLLGPLTTKKFLREMATSYLPADIVQHPKRGFEIPLQQWVDGELREIMMDHLLPQGAYVRSVVQPEFLDKLLNKTFAVDVEKRSRILYSFLAVEIWHKSIKQW